MDTCVCMGASIGMATGVVKVASAGRAKEGGGRDRRFDLPAHRHQRPDGHGLQQGAGHGHHPRQPHHRHDRPPGEPGLRLHPDGRARPRGRSCRCSAGALGVKNVVTVDPYDLEATRAVIWRGDEAAGAVGDHHQPALLSDEEGSGLREGHSSSP